MSNYKLWSQLIYGILNAEEYNKILIDAQRQNKNYSVYTDFNLKPNTKGNSFTKNISKIRF